jgi:predicted dehydrogenase
MSRRLSRRRFLQSTALAGAASLSAPLLLAANNKTPASERLAVGVIGVAGQGEYDWTNIVEGGAEIVAWCDVDERRTGKARERFPHAKFYPDFRHLLDQKGIDAVLVATPDHTHAPATLAALRADKHVYCEKPLTHTVYEARLVAQTAAKYKRVTQMGTQIHAGENYRQVVELIQAGAIGTVEDVHVWVGTGFGRRDRSKDRPNEKQEIPAGLHWDLWLGPAPARPYSSAYVPRSWRGWWDFGGGSLADMACHHMDLPFWALKLHAPTKITAEGPPPHPETTPLGLMVHYEFPARGELPPVKLTWYDGGKRPALFAQGKLPNWGNGSLFIGSKGMLLAGYEKHKLLPEKQFEGYRRPEPTIPRSIGHHKEWVEACKHGGPTTCNFQYAGALTEAVLLGNVSYRLGKPITWDSEKFRTNEPDAEKYLRPIYRAPWKL